MIRAFLREHLIVWLATFAIVIGSLACAGSSKKGSDNTSGKIEDGTTVNTIVEVQTIVLGESFGVKCEVRNKDGLLLEIETEFTVSPESTIIGSDATPRSFGKHTVTCKIKDHDVFDESPAEINVLAGSIDTVLDKSQIKAGEVANVTCVVKDKDGTVVTDAPTEVTVNPSEGTEVNGHAVKGKKVGNYNVACNLIPADQIDTTPASLEVVPGTPYRVVTALDSDTIKAGESTGVACKVEDEEGNEVTGVTTSIKDNPDLEVKGNQVSGTKAGKHEVRCQLEGVTTGVEEVPAELTITAGAPTKVKLVPNPDKNAYRTTENVTVTYVVTDDYDNEVTGINGTLTGPSGGGVTDNGGGNWTFDTEGAYTWKVVLESPFDSITDELTLYADNGPPTLLITYPERGDTVDGDKTVVVLGTVTDDGSGVESLTINGEEVKDIKPDGSFSHPTTAKHGLNFIEAIAKDKSQQTTRATVGYYYSTKFVPFKKDDEANTPMMDDGMVIRLSQDVIDDFDHPCKFDNNGDYVCDKVDDLATIGEILLNNIDLTSALGALKVFSTSLNVFNQNYPFSTGTLNLFGYDVKISANLNVKGTVNIDVEITDIDFNKVALRLDSRSGGIDAKIAVDKTTVNQAEKPGLFISTKTTISFDGTARFTSLQALANGSNLRGAICTAIDIYEALSGDTVTGQGAFCPNSSGVYAPLASVNPSLPIDSSATITKMELETGFNISVDNTGKLKVELVKGTIDFFGEKISLQITAGMKLQLGQVKILDGLITVPLPDIDLQPLANAIQGAVDALFNNFILDELQSLVEVAFNFIMTSDTLNLSKVISDALNQLAINQSIPLPKFTSGQKEAPLIAIATKISSILFEGYDPNDLKTGGVTLGLGTLFHSEKKTDREPLGSIIRDSCGLETPQELNFTKQQPFELAAHLDALNQAFYAIWWNGGFDLPITGADLGDLLDGGGTGLPIDLSEMDMKLKFLLPPILTNCGGKGLLEMQVGDLYIEASLKLGNAPINITGYVNFSAAVQIVVDNGTFGIEVKDTPEPFLELELLTVNGNPGSGGTFENLLKVILQDQLIGAFAGQALGGFPLPEIDMGSLVPGLSNGAKLKILPADIYDDAGYYIIRGDIDGN